MIRPNKIQWSIDIKNQALELAVLIMILTLSFHVRELSNLSALVPPPVK